MVEYFPFLVSGVKKSLEVKEWGCEYHIDQKGVCERKEETGVSTSG